MTTIGVKKLVKGLRAAYPQQADAVEAIAFGMPKGGLAKTSLKTTFLAEIGGIWAILWSNRRKDRKAEREATHVPTDASALALPQRFALALTGDQLRLMSIDSKLRPVEVKLEIPRGSYWFTERRKGVYTIKCNFVVPSGRYFEIEFPRRTIGKPNVPALEAIAAAGSTAPLPEWASAAK